LALLVQSQSGVDLLCIFYRGKKPSKAWSKQNGWLRIAAAFFAAVVRCLLLPSPVERPLHALRSKSRGASTRLAGNGALISTAPAPMPAVALFC
jgi:hypothetical protein